MGGLGRDEDLDGCPAPLGPPGSGAEERTERGRRGDADEGLRVEVHVGALTLKSLSLGFPVVNARARLAGTDVLLESGEDSATGNVRFVEKITINAGETLSISVWD